MVSNIVVTLVRRISALRRKSKLLHFALMLLNCLIIHTLLQKSTPEVYMVGQKSKLAYWDILDVSWTLGRHRIPR